MKLIVGLGNPGREYEKTRHNIGFNVLDLLADKYNITFSENKKFNALEASFNLMGEKVILVKPLTFMNLEGSLTLKEETVQLKDGKLEMPPCSIVVLK